MDIDDARDVFSAIVLAQPGGLGSAPNMMFASRRGPLLEAMREAATAT